MSQPAQPTVSVCIANYNGEHVLSECIESVLAQACDFGVEIIVHDDASTDNSVALIRERFPGLDLIASETNVGFCIANNRMAEQARGSHLLLLNNDAALLPGALSALVEAAESREAVYSLPQYDWIDGHLVDRGCLLDPFFNPVPNLDPHRTDVAMVIGACLLLPTRTWHELGGFPDWMGSVAEDLYLCGKARLRGLPVRVLDESGYRHRQGHSFGGNRANRGKLDSTYRRRALSERNKTLALAILTPSSWLWLVLPLHLLTLAAEGAALCVAKLSLEPLRRIYGPAIVSPLASLSLLRNHRCTEQSRRQASLGALLSCTRWVPRKLQLLWRHGLPGLR